MLVGTFPAIAPLNIMHLHSPTSAILSAVIFNALIIVALIRWRCGASQFKPIGRWPSCGATAHLRLGGVIIPFAGIKVIDVLITALGLV